MEWTEKQILDTLRMIETSEYDEVRIETADFKLHVRKSGAPAGLGATAATAAMAAPAMPMAAQPAAVAPPPVTTAPNPRPVAAVHPAEAPPPGILVVCAPMIGTFYRAPAPHAPPFTDVGAAVKRDDTVCLLEVMKLFNTIKAGADGTIVRILAQNAATVQKDEALLWIEPDAR